jgi:ferredoxin/flavodoxin---NADP+ reductase
MSAQKPHVIIVAGAGPAGLAAAGTLAEAGHEVIILNRDIKFGGLAEYGIFPSKLKLRGGLKKQYWELLERPNVHYFGNVSIGNGKDLTVDEVRGLGASAVVFAIGAQGTKAIGVEGDSAKGVFHAKDVVYHYCRLPGFGDRPFDMGKHVAVIGAGDVMVDIAHWLTRYKRVDRVTAIVRRGPAERKYNPKEIRAVCANMDLDGIKAEFARIKDRLIAVGQNPDEIYKGLVDEFTKCEPKVSETKMGFRFLASPKRILVDGNNRVRALEMEDNKLEPKGEDTAAVGLKQYYEFPCDSVVFAVGDKVDETVGLPYKGGVFVTNPNKTGNDPDDALFQAYDEATGRIVEGVFLAGWARKASEGLVGVAKRDGDWCAEVVSRYLAGKPAGSSSA